MSAATWTPPRPGPPGAAVTDDGRVFVWADPVTGVRRVGPAPILQDEVVAWVKPAGSTAFPLHPAGLAELHRRTALQLHARGVLARLSTDERGRLERECWRVAGVVFRQGVSMRAALEDAAATRSLWPDAASLQDSPDKMRTAQLCCLALRAVFSAVCAWSQEG